MLPWTPHQHSLFIETLPIGRAEYDASDGRRGIQEFSISLRIGLHMRVSFGVQVHGDAA